MVKISDVNVPKVFKDQLLFKAGNFNKLNISKYEVNKSVYNTKWDKFNTSLIYSHKDSDFGYNQEGKIVRKDWAESWVGWVKNIHTNGEGDVYGDVEVWKPETALILDFAKAPMAVSAGIAWDEKYKEPTNFVYRNFSLVASPGVVNDKNIFINFSEEKSHDGFNYANFSSLMEGSGDVIDSDSSQGSEVELHGNHKVKRKIKKFCNYCNKDYEEEEDTEENEESEKEKDMCNEKKVNFDSNEVELVNNGNDKEMLRSSIASELSAVSLYEDMANKTENEKLKKMFLDIAKEEKTHIGEFETLLKSFDKEQEEECENGEKEVEDKVGEIEANMMLEQIDDSHPTELRKKEVIDKKKWTMENQEPNVDETEKKENVGEENKVNFNDYRIERRSNKMLDNKEETVSKDKEANFEEVTEQSSQVTQPQPVIPQEQPQQTANPVMDGKFVEDVASRLADKIIPNLKPVPMTNNEFGGSFRTSQEEAVERLAKSLERR